MGLSNTLRSEAIRVVLPLVILGAGVAGFAAFSSFSRPPSRTIQEQQAPLVETVPVQLQQEGMAIEVDGLVVPSRVVTLSAEVAGKITRKTDDCKAGRYVTSGTLLLEIDPQTYTLEVERLEQELGQAQANRHELEVEIENTRELLKLADEELKLEQRQLKRYEDLFARAAVSESGMDDARRSELTVRNNRQTLDNQLKALQSREVRLEHAEQLVDVRLRQAKLDLAHTQIVAPIDGVIVEDMVERDGFVPIGTHLATIDDTSAVEIECNLRMDEIRWILERDSQSDVSSEEEPSKDYVLPQTPATVVYTLGDREFKWQGVLSRYLGIGLDEQTRTVPCRVVVAAPSQMTSGDAPGRATGGPRALVRGMYVRVVLHADPQHKLLRLPVEAIRPGNVVWRFQDGKLKIDRVKVARVTDDYAMIESTAAGLKVDDRVIVSPLAEAIDGMSLREKSGT